MKVFYSTPAPTTISARDMKIGQLGQVSPADSDDDHLYSEHILLRTYNGWVSLNNPMATWPKPGPTFPVTLLPRWSRVTLEVE
jgi:hypothetical protein